MLQFTESFSQWCTAERISYLVLWPLFRLWLRVVNCVASSNMKQWDNSKCQTFFWLTFLCHCCFALDADKLKFSVRGNLSRVHTPLDVPAAVNPAAFPALSNRFPAMEEMLCEERSACLCSMFTSHLLCVCVCLGRGRSPLTMETIISAITYPISCEKRRRHCARITERPACGKKQSAAFSDERVFYRKRLAHHICHDYRSTFCNRPAALLLLFFPS